MNHTEGVPPLYPLNSTAITAAGYDASHERLWIAFRSGELLSYEKVPPTEIEALRHAPSPGTYFNSHIRDAYRTWTDGT